MHQNISELYTHMGYMPLYKSFFVLGLLWQVGGIRDHPPGLYLLLW